MNENTELQTVPVKSLDELSKGDKKALILSALKAQGFNDSEAAKLMEVSRQYTNKLDKQGRTGTLFPLVNMAKRAVKNTLKGEATGDAAPPKTSDVIMAAKMVLDRSDPVIQKVENTKTTYNIDLGGDREKYLKALGLSKVIEAEFTLVDESCEKPLLPS